MFEYYKIYVHLWFSGIEIFVSMNRPTWLCCTSYILKIFLHESILTYVLIVLPNFLIWILLNAITGFFFNYCFNIIKYAICMLGCRVWYHWFIWILLLCKFYRQFILALLLAVLFCFGQKLTKRVMYK